MICNTMQTNINLKCSKGPVIKYRGGGGLEKIGSGSPIFESLKGGGALKIEHQYGGGSR